MSEAPSQAATKRPALVTILCIIGFISAVFSLPLTLSKYANDVGPWYPPFLASAALIGVVVFIGFWRMRLWTLYVYFVMFLINQAVLIATHIWSPLAAIVPIVVLIIGFSYRSWMR